MQPCRCPSGRACRYLYRLAGLFGLPTPSHLISSRDCRNPHSQSDVHLTKAKLIRPEAVLTLSYRILFQVATRSSVKQSHTSQLISALKLVSTHERIAMVILTAAWVFTFIFEIVIDSSLDKSIWRSSHLRAVEIVRLLAVAFAL